MANSHRVPKDIEALRGDLSSLKLKIVLLEKQEAELERIEQESDADEALQMLVKNSEQKMLRYIDRSCRKDEIKRLVFRTFPQVAKVAACLLLVCYLGLTAAVATDSTVRIRLMQFIVTSWSVRNQLYHVFISETYKVSSGTYKVQLSGTVVASDGTTESFSAWSAEKTYN